MGKSGLSGPRFLDLIALELAIARVMARRSLMARGAVSEGFPVKSVHVQATMPAARLSAKYVPVVCRDSEPVLKPKGPLPWRELVPA